LTAHHVDDVHDAVRKDDAYGDDDVQDVSKKTITYRAGIGLFRPFIGI
jgi:hypothetical protein